MQFRRVSNPQTVNEFVLDVAFSRIQAGERALLFVGITGDVHQNEGVLAVGRQLDVRNRGETDTRVRQLSFDHGGDLFAHGVGHPLAMMLCSSVLVHGHYPSLQYYSRYSMNESVMSAPALFAIRFAERSTFSISPRR